ncbi:DUF4241 domain-containing protein [Streptomyces sp. NPDC097640]|uniref:DUF4241 domain-containing protein n=1 Tax=Streptomyces sp. NPDC097640 TaxID=3157229 RepID=UPI0033321CDE
MRSTADQGETGSESVTQARTDRRPAGRGPVHTLDSHFTVELPSTEPEPNLIAFRTGRGDGAYPVRIGRTDDGRVGCVVVDFQLHSADGGE